MESVGDKLNIAIIKRNRKEEFLQGCDYIVEPETKTPTSAKPNLVQLREQFLQQKRLTRKQDGSKLDTETISAYEQETEDFLKIAKKTYPEQVTGNDLRRWMNVLEERGKSHRTVVNKYTTVACFLKFCGVDHKILLPLNERPRPHDAEPTAYDLKDVTRFLFCIERERDRLYFEFLLKTGAREREGTCLEWDDISFGDNPTVKFQNKPHLKFRVKTGKSRMVPLERELAAKLEDFQKRNPGMKLVFGTRNDLEDTHFYEVCKDKAELAGFNKDAWWLHKFRDTFATMALRRGVDIRTVQGWLGHSSITMTMRYLATAESELAQQNINTAFGGLKLEVAAISAAV